MSDVKKMLSLILMLVLLGGLGIAVAANSFTPDGNDRKGKYLYKKNCRTCHDGTKEQVQVLSPSTKTQAQWQRAFEDYERLDCVAEWQKLSQDDLKDIYSYLYNHAYDSPQPATCQ